MIRKWVIRYVQNLDAYDYEEVFKQIQRPEWTRLKPFPSTPALFQYVSLPSGKKDV